jgi:transposase
VAVVAVRTKGLRVLAYDEQLEVLRMLVDRREELTKRRIQTVNRLQRLLAELTPGKVKKDITALQAKVILSSVRPRDLVGKTRKTLASEQLTELLALDAKIKASTKELKTLVLERGSSLMDLTGVGPVAPRGSWPTSATWPGSPTGAGSPPGPGPHQSTPPPASRSGTGCLGPETAKPTT